VFREDEAKILRLSLSDDDSLTISRPEIECLQESEGQDKLAHVIFHFDGKESAFPMAFGTTEGTDFWGLQTPRIAAMEQSQALKNAAKFTASKRSL